MQKILEKTIFALLIFIWVLHLVQIFTPELGFDMMHNMQLSNYLEKTPKKYLIFDFDETIARIEMDWSQYYSRMGMVYEKYDPSRQHHAFTDYEGYNDFVREYGVEGVKLIKAANQKYEKEFSHGLIPHPELVRFIKESQGYEMFVYSSNSRSTVLAGLEELEILGKFKKIVSRDEVTYIKPDPDGFGLIYDPDMSKKDYLMIGNSHADRVMAKTAGIDFYLVDYF